jgi:hypothetical protein
MELKITNQLSRMTRAIKEYNLVNRMGKSLLYCLQKSFYDGPDGYVDISYSFRFFFFLFQPLSKNNSISTFIKMYIKCSSENKVTFKIII